MPLYEYICDKCGNSFEQFAKMDDFEKDQSCTCGGIGKRIISNASTDLVRNVRISKSLGLHPKQIASGEAEKLHPGAKWTPKGDLIIHSRKEKLQRMKERGLTAEL